MMPSIFVGSLVANGHKDYPVNYFTCVTSLLKIYRAQGLNISLSENNYYSYTRMDVFMLDWCLGVLPQLN